LGKTATRWASRIAIFVVLLIVGAVGINAASHYTEHDAAPPPAPPPEQAPQLPPPALGAQWRYTTPQTAAASTAGVEACTKSQADIGIGGGGRSGAEFCLRRGGGYPYAASILLGDTHGRFVCAGCAVKVRFDDGGAQSFDATAASTDGTDYTLFIPDGARLAGVLKRASTATFSVSIHGAGEQQVMFDVAGLKWSS
jgi:hypothetical protein